MVKTREKQGGYRGIENVKFAKKINGGYTTELLKLLYAQGLSLTPKVSDTSQYADNRELFKIPSDTGLEGELKTTAPDPELDKLAGFAIEGASGLIDMSATSYIRGAIYFEFIGHDGAGASSKIKVWLLNVEVGKGAKSFATAKGSVELGDYAYPFKVYGDPLMSADGSTEFFDERGMGHQVFQYTSYPGDADYDDFDKAVPEPKVIASATPPTGN